MKYSRKHTAEFADIFSMMHTLPQIGAAGAHVLSTLPSVVKSASRARTPLGAIELGKRKFLYMNSTVDPSLSALHATDRGVLTAKRALRRGSNIKDAARQGVNNASLHLQNTLPQTADVPYQGIASNLSNLYKPR